jgi:hypothetical protein
VDEVAQLRRVHPQLARYIGPPGHLRANITTPLCTEGSDFCSVKIWLDFRNTPRRISAYTQNSNHYPFIPEDLGLFSYAAMDVSSFAYSGANGFVYPPGWLVWLVYDASDVASDDAAVEVITTDGQHISVPYDLSRLR